MMYGSNLPISKVVRHQFNRANAAYKIVVFLTEKEFISNVSHELQTPISILKSRLRICLWMKKD